MEDQTESDEEEMMRRKIPGRVSGVLKSSKPSASRGIGKQERIPTCLAVRAENFSLCAEKADARVGEKGSTNTTSDQPSSLDMKKARRILANREVGCIHSISVSIPFTC
jgi:hypothetical protein